MQGQQNQMHWEKDNSEYAIILECMNSGILNLQLSRRTAGQYNNIHG